MNEIPDDDRTVLVGDTYETPAAAAQYAADEAEALGHPADCLNCGTQTILCGDPDCWHHGNVEGRVHTDSGSHYCHLGDASDMVAEVDRNG